MESFDTSNSSIRSRTISRYQSAVSINASNNKAFDNYRRTNYTNEYLSALGDLLGVSKDSLIVYGDAPNALDKWVYPQVATHMAMHISPMFAACATQWIEEWKLHSKDNQDIYTRNMDSLQPSIRDSVRTSMRNNIAAMYDGKVNVRCPSGTVDVVTREYVIEVKPIIEWKQAIGHAQVYSIDMSLKPVIYLFTTGGEVDASCKELRHIRTYCKRLGVIILNDLHRPCLFNKLSKEALLSIVMFTLTVDIRSVHSLAITKRVWDITNAIWPAVARSQLRADVTMSKLTSTPRSVHPEEFMKTFLTIPNKYPLRTLTLCSRSHHRADRHVITIEASDDKISITLHDFTVTFTRSRWRYIVHSSEQKTGEHTMFGTPIAKTVDVITTRGHCRVIKPCVERILPELADSIDFRC